MLIKNLTVTITEQNGPQEDELIHIKSSKDRNYALIEVLAPKLSAPIEELQQALELVKQFSLDNPLDKKEEAVQSHEPELEVMKLEHSAIEFIDDAEKV